MHNFELTPRVVLVTGGSRGIGEACVRRFAENGDSVAFFYSKSEEAARRVAKETGALAVRVDVSDPAAVSEAVRASAPVSVITGSGSSVSIEAMLKPKSN